MIEITAHTGTFYHPYLNSISEIPDHQQFDKLHFLLSKSGRDLSVKPFVYFLNGQNI